MDNQKQKDQKGIPDRAGIFFAFLAVLYLAGCASSPPSVQALNPVAPAYDYPLDNAYAATIIGTPPAIKVSNESAPIPTEREVAVFPRRKVPEGFWYYDGLKYGEMLQDQPAPLVYIIGGTGSGYKSRYTVALANMLFSAGNHVVLLPSPTHSSFIVTASENFFPGRADNDARDIYRVINIIHPRIKDKVSVTSVGLTGYSLGGWHAAFVGELDERERRIGFDKILLINPPLNLYSSIHRLDDMLNKGLPGGLDDLNRFYDKAVNRLSRMSADSDALDFRNENFLMDSYLSLRPTDQEMETIIGLAFRLTAANMIFTSDVMSHAGYIYPKDRPYLSTTPLDDYMKVAVQTGFTDYFKDIYRTHYRAAQPELTDEALIEQSSLAMLESWISTHSNIRLITNQDDIILAPGELSELERLFAGKSRIFPTGGHLGNMEHPAFAHDVAAFFGRGQ